MISFKPSFIERFSITLELQWRLNSCYESRGKEAFWYAQKREVLSSLRDLALVQSVESSNRMEGVVTSDSRLRPLLKGDFQPRDRLEEELIGYKKALKYIHENHKELVVDSVLIKKLHHLAQDGMIGDAGKWKQVDNEIIEISKTGGRSIRFQPVSASKTDKYIEQLCLAYNDLINKNDVPDLVIISFFIFDFLCIHPFRDGNGRVSRLLTQLLLYKSGFTVGCFISLEKIIEENKDKYYSCLKVSSEGWHTAEHDIFPWFRFFLEVLREAYRGMESQVESLAGASSKSDLIRSYILQQELLFSLKIIQENLPNVSEVLIKKVLAQLKSEGLVVLSGKGRGAKWRVLRK